MSPRPVPTPVAHQVLIDLILEYQEAYRDGVEFAVATIWTAIRNGRKPDEVWDGHPAVTAPHWQNDGVR